MVCRVYRPMKVQLPVPPNLLVGLLAPAYLLTHRWGEDFAQTLTQAGVWSEEIFRGDRLPSLPFPDVEQSDSPEPSP